MKLSWKDLTYRWWWWYAHSAKIAATPMVKLYKIKSSLKFICFIKVNSVVCCFFKMQQIFLSRDYNTGTTRSNTSGCRYNLGYTPSLTRFLDIAWKTNVFSMDCKPATNKSQIQEWEKIKCVLIEACKE